jgi:hypothetical protein
MKPHILILPFSVILILGTCRPKENSSFNSFSFFIDSCAIAGLTNCSDSLLTQFRTISGGIGDGLQIRQFEFNYPYHGVYLLEEIIDTISDTISISPEKYMFSRWGIPGPYFKQPEKIGKYYKSFKIKNRLYLLSGYIKHNDTLYLATISECLRTVLLTDSKEKAQGTLGRYRTILKGL